MLCPGMFAGIVHGLFHNEKDYALFAHLKVLKDILVNGNDDVLRVGLFDLVCHGFQSSHEPL